MRLHGLLRHPSEAVLHPAGRMPCSSPPSPRDLVGPGGEWRHARAAAPALAGAWARRSQAAAAAAAPSVARHDHDAAGRRTSLSGTLYLSHSRSLVQWNNGSASSKRPRRIRQGEGLFRKLNKTKSVY